MANVGTVTIDFAAETAKFTAALKQVRGELRSLKEDTHKLAEGFSSAWSTIEGVVTSAVILGGIRAIIKATSESEAAIAKLNNALSLAGANVEASSADFQKFATEMQKVTAFSDEAVIGVVALLTGFRGLSSGTIKQATADVLDLSTRLGIDLDSAARLVGKALEDPIHGMEGLSKAGAKFTDAQKEVIKALVETGDKAGAQQIILQELESRSLHAASTFKNTLSGAIQGVKNAFDDLLEAKGGMPGATTALNKLTETLNSPEIKKGFDVIIGGLATIIEFSVKAITAISNLGNTLGKVLAKFVVPDFDKTASQVLEEQLRLAEKQLEIRSKGFFHSKAELDVLRSQIETLKQRIELAKGLQVEADLRKTFTAPEDFSFIDRLFGKESDFTTPDVPQEIFDRHLEAIKASLANEAAAQDAHDMIMQDKIIIANDFEFQMAQNLNDSLSALDQVQNEEHIRRVDEQVKAVELAERQMLAFRQRGVNAAVTLLTAYGGRFAAISKAILAVNAFFKIKETIIATRKAVMETYAHYGGTPWGIAAAAGVAVLGAAQVAAIASEAGVGGSGSAIGSPNNPVFTDNTGATDDNRTFGASSRSVVQIEFNGMVTEAAAREIAELLGEIVNESDVVFIDPQSRQGQALRP